VRRRAVLAAAAAGAALGILASSAAAAQTPVRIAGVDTAGYPHVVLNVVTRAHVSTPPHLTENGAPVVGLDAVNLGDAKSLVIAIDNSRSMSGSSLANAKSAARAFVHRKHAGDRVAVIAFGRRAVQLTGFSTSSAEAEGVLGGLAVAGSSGTALYDAVVQASQALRTSSLAGRVIVLLTDGSDVSSHASLDGAISAARKAGVSIYPIGIEGPAFDATALKELARGTNGTYYGAGSSAALAQVYTSIAAELDSTWRLGYDTTARPGDKLVLRASLKGVGTTAQTLTVPATFGPAEPAPSTGVLPSAAYSTLGTLLFSLLVATIALSAVLVLVRMRRGSWVKQRLAPHVGEAERRGMRRNERLSFLAALFRATEGAFGRHSLWRSIERLLIRGAVPLRPAEFVWATLGSAVVGGIVLAVAGAPILLILVAGLGGGGAVPYAVVSLRVRKRAKAFENQLPDLLTTIAATLKAGHSFKHGLQAVVDESTPPASEELKRVLTETGLGRPMDDALAEMAERVGSENFEFAITAVTIQRQVGGSLATLFDMVSETVRNRQQFARKVRSLTSMGRMSAYTLVAIPFFIAGMVWLTNKSYMDPLFHTHIGHLLLIVGMMMMSIGSLILKKIVAFKG
jgi:tight adherence protein B